MQQQPTAVVQQQQPTAIAQQQQPAAIVQQQQPAAIVQQQQPAAIAQQQQPHEMLSLSVSVRYQNNNSKRWDGREIWIDSEYMESLYTDPSMLVPGFEVLLPWKGKNSTGSYSGSNN